MSTKQRSEKNSDDRDFQTRYSFPFTMEEDAPDALRKIHDPTGDLLCVCLLLAMSCLKSPKLSLSLAFSVKNCLFSFPSPIFAYVFSGRSMR